MSLQPPVDLHLVDLERLLAAHRSSTNELTRPKFVDSIFPSGSKALRSLRDTLFDFPDVKSDSARKSIHHRVCCGENGARKRFVSARDHLAEARDKGTRELYTYRNSPFRQDLSACWRSLLSLDTLAPPQREALKRDLKQLVNRTIPDDPAEQPQLQIRARLLALAEAEQLDELLACLTLLACTCHCWHWLSRTAPGYSDAELRLQQLVLPPMLTLSADALGPAHEMLARRTGTLAELQEKLSACLKDPHLMGEANYLLYQRALQLDPNHRSAGKYLAKAIGGGHREAKIQYYSEKAAVMLEEIKALTSGDRANDPRCILEACHKCEKLLNDSSFVDKQICAEACFLLYQYVSTRQYTPASSEYSAMELLRMSRHWNCAPADAIWNEYRLSSLIPRITTPAAEHSGESYLNCVGGLADIYLKSLPRSWQDHVLPLEPACILRHLGNGRPKRFLFLSDDLSQNFRQTLELLELIRSHNPTGLEIFLRCAADTTSPLIDTALSHIPHCKIPVYILDEDKMAAQQLLSRYPLHFPLRDLDLLACAKRSPEERPELRLVVVGSTTAAQWLVREAFALMGFRDNAVRCRISVYAPDGQSFAARLKAQCPGMIEGNASISHVPLPLVEGVDWDPGCADHMETLAGLDSIPNTCCFYVVAAESAQTNLDLARRLREALIRSHIRRSNRIDLEQPAPIAFLCRDPYVAGLSKSLVVESESFGERWFNSWQLIPFGDPTASFTWSELGREANTLEQMALSVHLQYCSVSPGEALAETESARACIQDYYRRHYNRDSSLTVALSMPYRLFQFRDRHGAHIAPRFWDILDSTTFTDPQRLRALSHRLQDSPFFRDEILAVARWEHDRWIRWMLSRGWMPASPEQAVLAFRSGNPRQQLFVARLHPCICSYDELEALADTLRTQCRIKKDFYGADQRNIEATPDLLALAWLTPPEQPRD